MSGLALVCHRLGATVTRQRPRREPYLARLRDAGLEPRVGHDADGPERRRRRGLDRDRRRQPELARARERGQRVIHRGELLAELCSRQAPDRGRRDPRQDDHRRDAGARPARDRRRPGLRARRRAAGRGPGRRAANAGWGDGEWMVAEADESDASFLSLARRSR